MKSNFRAVVCIVLMLFMIATIFFGCAKDDKLAGEISNRFVRLSSRSNLSDYSYAIYVDSETRVMYVVISGGSSAGITALLNADGTPMLYSGELNGIQ